MRLTFRPTAFLRNWKQNRDAAAEKRTVGSVRKKRDWFALLTEERWDASGEYAEEEE
ncbi:MAG: hypothetical protein WCV62_01065 [Candidatus Peribacteraceae bacterium]